MNPGKTLKTPRHAIEYLAVIVFYAVLRLVPRGLRLRLAGLFGGIAYLVTPRRVAIAVDNLTAAFPKLTPSERKQIVRQVYRNLAGNAIDEIQLARAVASVSIALGVEAKLAHLRRLNESGRPLIFVTGHYGNWEVLGEFLTTRFANINFLAKEQSNPYIDRMVNGLRNAMGGTVIPTHTAARAVPKLLKRGENLVLVGDQDAGREGVMIDFLGRPAAYFRGWALFSYHYNAPVAFMFLRREAQGFALNIADIVEPNLAADREAEIKRLLILYSNYLAAAITVDPGQWLWTHRRWKSGTRAT